MTAQELQTQALDRARNGETASNYPAIFAGFLAKGVPEAEILPRENVFTFHAWKALGRSVKKGEHGVRVLTYVPMGKDDTDETTGEVKHRAWTSPRSTTVFHISQTEVRP